MVTSWEEGAWENAIEAAKEKSIPRNQLVRTHILQAPHPLEASPVLPLPLLPSSGHTFLSVLSSSELCCFLLFLKAILTQRRPPSDQPPSCSPVPEPIVSFLASYCLLALARKNRWLFLPLTKPLSPLISICLLETEIQKSPAQVSLPRPLHMKEACPHLASHQLSAQHLPLLPGPAILHNLPPGLHPSPLCPTPLPSL